MRPMFGNPSFVRYDRPNIEKDYYKDLLRTFIGFRVPLSTQWMWMVPYLGL